MTWASVPCIDEQDLFYATEKKKVAQAKELCRSCEKRTACLDRALLRPEFGTWGGLTKRERLDTQFVTPSDRAVASIAERLLSEQQEKMFRVQEVFLSREYDSSWSSELLFEGLPVFEEEF